jgi:hypothetical protein
MVAVFCGAATFLIATKEPHCRLGVSFRFGRSLNAPYPAWRSNERPLTEPLRSRAFAFGHRRTVRAHLAKAPTAARRSLAIKGFLISGAARYWAGNWSRP